MVQSNGADAPPTLDTMIGHALIGSMDEQRRIISDGAIAWTGDRIVAVGKTEHLRSQYVAGHVIDGARFVITRRRPILRSPRRRHAPAPCIRLHVSEKTGPGFAPRSDESPAAADLQIRFRSEPNFDCVLGQPMHLASCHVGLQSSGQVGISRGLIEAALNFSTESLPPRQQRKAWCDALSRLNLSASGFDDRSFCGAVSCVVSPLGVEFVRLASTTQDLANRPSPHRKGIWLALLLGGEASAADGERSFELAPGDIAFGPSNGQSHLVLRSHATLFLVRIPKSVLSHRLLSPLAVKLGSLPGDRGVSHVLSGILISLADAIDKLDKHQIRTVERLVTDLFVTSLSADPSRSTLGGVAGMRAALFNRILQATDAGLADPELSARQVADSVGISLRYLQKLLQDRGLSFRRYVLDHRLERIRDDLGNANCGDRSILHICIHWGFSDAAWFSRAFRARYGCSAREYRGMCLLGAARAGGGDGRDDAVAKAVAAG
jgi:AraC-like DNA-binding protein